jgi:hypothetical protein
MVDPNRPRELEKGKRKGYVIMTPGKGRQNVRP